MIAEAGFRLATAVYCKNNGSLLPIVHTWTISGVCVLTHATPYQND